MLRNELVTKFAGRDAHVLDSRKVADLADCAVAADHDAYEWAEIRQQASPVVDIRHVMSFGA